MASPSADEDIKSFLENTRTVRGRELDVAIVYASSMAEELRVSVAQWEATAAKLQDQKRDGSVLNRN